MFFYSFNTVLGTGWCIPARSARERGDKILIYLYQQYKNASNKRFQYPDHSIHTI